MEPMEDAEEEKSPQQYVMETIWTYTGWAVVLLACIGAGFYIGYLRWGDAPALKLRVDSVEKQVMALKNERETLNTKLAKMTQERDECRNTASKTAGGAAGGAAPAVVVE
jgi:hypothetical protein